MLRTIYRRTISENMNKVYFDVMIYLVLSTCARHKVLSGPRQVRPSLKYGRFGPVQTTQEFTATLKQFETKPYATRLVLMAVITSLSSHKNSRSQTFVCVTAFL